MAVNYPGPYQLDIHYTVSGETHVAKYNVNLETAPSPGDSMSLINLVQRDGGLTPILSAITDWVNVIKAQFHTSVTFDLAELWSVAPLSTDRTYINSQTIGIAGTSSNPVNLAHQVTMTFRTVEGGVMKIILLETSGVTLVREPYAGAHPGYQAIMDYVEGDDGWFLGRDTSYPIAKLNVIGGQNERVFKKRYR